MCIRKIDKPLFVLFEKFLNSHVCIWTGNANCPSGLQRMVHLFEVIKQKSVLQVFYDMMRIKKVNRIFPKG